MNRLKINNQCQPECTKEEIELRWDVVHRANAILVDQQFVTLVPVNVLWRTMGDDLWTRHSIILAT